MERLEYPLDSKLIIRKKKSIKRELINKFDDLLKIKIAILGGSTTSEVKDILELFLLNEGIEPEFYECEYNKYFEDIMFGNELRQFNPDIIYIYTNIRNLRYKPDLNNSVEEVEKKLNQEYMNLECLWEKIKCDFNSIIIQNNFEFPKNRSLGNLDGTSYFGVTNYINRLNMKICDYKFKNKGFIINDINYLASSIGLDKWHDLTLWYSYKYAISFEAIPHLCKNTANIIKAIYGKTKKCLVLDLDNTLWGGIVGDDGVENIKIGSETAIGEAYVGFQRYIGELRQRGVTLAIASKNENIIAMEGLKHPEMHLKEKHFTNIKANWEPKYINVEKISQEINIGLDSLVFIDDNALERDIVKSQLPQVEVPDISDNIINYIDYIDKNGYFESIDILKDDMYRNRYYESNHARQEGSSKFDNYDDFLKSLDMIADIQEFKPIYLDRIAQLTNKTNQFNLTTERYTLKEIEEIYKSENMISIYCRLKDKFGDNGLISIVIGEIKDNRLEIKLWLMSCRVLKRDVEKIVFDKIIEMCVNKNIKEIYGYYYKTNKNMMVKDHYKMLGFKNIGATQNSSEWKLSVDEVKCKLNKYIKIGEY